MTVSLKIGVNGGYVATVKSPGVADVSVGPGLPEKVEQSVYFPHGQGPITYTIEERQATQEEIDKAMGRVASEKKTE